MITPDTLPADLLITLLVLLAIGIALDFVLFRWRQWLASRGSSLGAILAGWGITLRTRLEPLAARIKAWLPARPAGEVASEAQTGETAPESIPDSTPPDARAARVQISAEVPPGGTIHITISSPPGPDGVQPPILVTIVDGQGRDVATSAPLHTLTPPIWRRDSFVDRVGARLSAISLPGWLFLVAIGLYLASRLIGLDKFPIYFFTDEAVQTQSIAQLVQNEYIGPKGVFLPTYFQNGDYFNLSTSVYAQWLPFMLFGKSAIATRATSALITLIAALAVGIALRNIFKLKHWWLGTLFLSITPAWFLHSRTAFETAEYVSFYAGALCCYLFYRYRSPRYIYPTLLLSALAFYTYSAGQVVVTVTALLLLISDWRYHWEHRKTLVAGVALVGLLAIPYLRFRLGNPDAPFNHLRELGSYVVAPGAAGDKIVHYLTEFAYGLSPGYWYIPNDHDYSRHLMKNYGDIMMATLPFAMLGLSHVLRHLRESSNRVALIALIAAPVGAALVGIGITRVLSFVIPAAIVTAIGLDLLLGWVEDPGARLAELRSQPTPSILRTVIGLAILLGLMSAVFALKPEDSNGRLALSFFLLLAFQASGLPILAAQWFSDFRPGWHASSSYLAVAAALVLGMSNVAMLRDALVNGPLWYDDYGLGGLQFGGFQIFNVVEQYLKEHPETRIIFSPTWSNGTNVLEDFFVEDESRLQMGSIDGHLTRRLPLDDNLLFVMTPSEFERTASSPKFKDIRVELTYPYPNGAPGFYFVRLRYVDNVDEIFAAEQATRRILRDDILTIDGESVYVRYPVLDMGGINLVFDGDKYSVARTMEANPFVLELAYPGAHTIKGFSIVVGSIQADIRLVLYATPDAPPVEYLFNGRGSIDAPELSFDLPAPAHAQKLRLELFDPNSPEPTHVHVWELIFR